MGIECLVLLQGIERFVGIEGLDLEEPVIRLMVLFDELQPLLKCDCLGCLFFGLHIAAVDGILDPHPSVRRVTHHDLLVFKHSAAVILVR